MIIDIEKSQEPKEYRQAPRGYEHSDRWETIPEDYEECSVCWGKGSVRGHCNVCICIERCPNCKGTGAMKMINDQNNLTAEQESVQKKAERIVAHIMWAVNRLVDGAKDPYSKEWLIRQILKEFGERE